MPQTRTDDDANWPGGAAPGVPAASTRLLSLDAYRGFVMLLLMFFDGPNSDWAHRIASDKPGTFAAAIARQFDHVAWAGCVLWDMIQPSFMFLVGASLAFSYRARALRGQSYGRMFCHAVYRAVFLTLLGVFLRSQGQDQTYWTLEDVLSQIGLGYVFLFLLWNRPWKLQLGVAAAILVGYWALFAFWPLPPAGYDYAAVSGEKFYDGFAAHWNKNAHPAHYFDQWLLNKFPRAQPFVANGGGYNTLNFIPSLATMIFGLVAGELLACGLPARRKLALLAWSGLAMCLVGYGLDALGICPLVKRIWTPSFALFSGGICLLVTAALYAVIDVRGWRRWAFPAIVPGRNSIAAYLLVHLVAGWILAALLRHFGAAVFSVAGSTYQPLLENLATGTCLWLILYWMYRRGFALRI